MLSSIVIGFGFDEVIVKFFYLRIKRLLRSVDGSAALEVSATYFEAERIEVILVALSHEESVA